MSTDELERLLKAGTPGPWKIERGKRCIQGPDTGEGDALVITSVMGGSTQWSASPYQEYCTAGMHEGDANAALIVAAINALPGLIESAKENAILKRLAPEYYQWPGKSGAELAPEWLQHCLKYGGASVDGDILAVYDWHDRRSLAAPGDYVVDGEKGLYVLVNARAALKGPTT